MTLMAGCGNENRELDRCIQLREKLAVTGCAFCAIVTADFGDSLYTFTLDCRTDAQGTMTFTVLEPQEIAGIGGTVKAGKGKLEYEDVVLAFPLLAEGELSPVSIPWVLLSALRGGNLVSCGKDGEWLLVTLRDSFSENALELEVWLNEKDSPVKADILWKGRRTGSIVVEDFHFV